MANRISLKERIQRRRSKVKKRSILDVTNSTQDIVQHKSALGNKSRNLGRKSARRMSVKLNNAGAVIPKISPPTPIDDPVDPYVPPLSPSIRQALGAAPSASGNQALTTGHGHGSKAAFRASNRLGLGPKPGDLSTIDAVGAHEWALAQLDVDVADYAVGKPTVLDNMRYLRFIINKEAFGREPGIDASDTWKQCRKFGQPHAMEQGFLFYRDLCTTNHDVLARIDMFWGMDHFSMHSSFLEWGVMDTDMDVYAFITDTIHSHSRGNFADMVIAVSKLPKMQHYLNNKNNGGRVGAGLNENFGREILELHTLGVDNGYTQEDVVAISQMLTGWNYTTPYIDAPAAEVWTAGEFVFKPHKHNLDHKVSGTVRSSTHIPVLDWETGEYDANDGVEIAEDIIRRICATPFCAEFIATKLLQEFVSETPSTEDITTIKQVFLDNVDSPTQLKEVYKAIFNLPHIFDIEANSLYKQSDHYLLSVYRATGLIDGNINPNYADPAVGYNPSSYDLTPDYITARGDIEPDWDRMYWQGLDKIAVHFQDLKNYDEPTNAGLLNRKLLKNLFAHKRGLARSYLISLGSEYGRYRTPEGPSRLTRDTINGGALVGRVEILDEISGDILANLQTTVVDHLRGVFPVGAKVMKVIQVGINNTAGGPLSKSRPDARPGQFTDTTQLIVAFMSDEFLRR